MPFHLILVFFSLSILILSFLLPLFHGLFYVFQLAFSSEISLFSEQAAFYLFPRKLFLGLIISLVTTFFSLLLACLIASLSFRHHHARENFWTRFFVLTGLSTPHVAFALGLVFLVVPSGPLFRIFSSYFGWVNPPPINIASDNLGIFYMVTMVFRETPFLLFVILAALSQKNLKKYYEVARSFGYHHHQAWLGIIFPVIYKRIRYAIFLVMAFVMVNVEVAMIAGPKTPSLFSVQLFELFGNGDVSKLQLAAKGSLLLPLMIGVGIVLWKLLEIFVKKMWLLFLQSGRTLFLKRTKTFLSNFVEVVFCHSAAMSLFLLLVVYCFVFVILIFWSIVGQWPFPNWLPQDFSLNSWRLFFDSLRFLSSPFINPITNSLFLAIFSTFFSIVICLMIFESENLLKRKFSRFPIFFLKIFKKIWIIPFFALYLPEITYLLGLEVFFLKLDLFFREFFKPFPLKDLVFTTWVHFLFVFPYIYLILHNVYFSFDYRYTVLYRSFGKSEWIGFLKVKLAFLAKPLIFAFSLGASVSIAQYLSTVFIGGAAVPTVTTETMALISSGNSRTVAAYALVQVALPCLFFFSALMFSKKFDFISMK